jgi:hypothetical protein|tara:strand:- start:504 stop:917 length:414 start_codon:yes stop_codon:yes gene_type:complete
MSLSVSIEACENHLYVQVKGVDNTVEAIDRFNEVLDACRQYNMSRVLIDFREVQGETFRFERYIYVTSIAEQIEQYLAAGGVPLRIAFVGPESMISDDKYGEDIAADHNLDMFETTEITEATEWLEIDSQQDLDEIE